MIRTELWDALQAAGFTVVKVGRQEIPVKGLEVTLSECVAAGAIKYHAPRRVWATVGKKGQWISLGNGLYAVFDTLVLYEGVTGKLSWSFTQVGEMGVLHETEKSTGVGVFTDERMREATEVK